MSRPTEGGSYVVREDGTLERVEFTAPAKPPPAPTEPKIPAADVPAADAPTQRKPARVKKEA